MPPMVTSGPQTQRRHEEPFVLQFSIFLPNRVGQLGELLDILGESYEGYERTVDVHVKNLRRKLTSASAGKGCNISTVHGVGYKLTEPDNV